MNWENAIGTTPLETAVSMGEPDVEVIRLLLKAGANPNRPRLREGDACISLLEALDGRRPRDQRRQEIRRLLKQFGAQRYRPNSKGEPCPHFASWNSWPQQFNMPTAVRRLRRRCASERRSEPSDAVEQIGRERRERVS